MPGLVLILASGSVGQSPAGTLFTGYPFSGWTFVSRFDTAGNINRLLNFCPDQGQEFNDYKISPSGDQYITGWFISDSVTIGTQVVYNTPPAGGIDLFFAKFDSAGLFQWVVHAGDSNLTTIQGTGIDFFQNGEIILSGDISPSVTLGGFIFSNSLSTTPGRSVPFVAKFNPAGLVLWADNSENQYVTMTTGGVRILSNNHTYFTGFFGGNAIFGSNTFSSTGLKDIFLGEVDPSGTITSGNKIDGTGSNEEPQCINRDINNNIFIGGGFDGTLTVNGNTYTNAGGNTDGFIAKFGTQTNCTVALKKMKWQMKIKYQFTPTLQKKKITVQSNDKIKKIEIINTFGEIIISKNNFSAKEKGEIIIASLPNGLYILKLTTSQGFAAKKFIKRNL